MDNRGAGSKSKNFGFTREARRIYPNENENDEISIPSIDKNSPTSTVS